MTLDKHKLDGLAPISVKILSAEDFEKLMRNAGYEIIGSAPAQGNRIKVWWSHPNFRRVEAIYSRDRRIAITAYHT